MSQSNGFDLAIVGAGPGGYTAAIRAAQLGASVALIEKEGLGGTCLQWGCIPTKKMAKTAELLENMQEAERFALETEDPRVDLPGLMAQKDDVVKTLQEGVTSLLDGHGVVRYQGEAHIEEDGSVAVEADEGESFPVKSERVLLAVGSKPAMPPIPGTDLEGILTSRDLLSIDELPESLLIIGGGVIGMEFASIFNSFGTQVTVLEMLPKILPPIDDELARRLGPLLRRKGITSVTGATVTKIEGDVPREKRITYEHRGREKSIQVERVLLATGRVPNTKDIPLDALGIEHENGAICVNEQMVTTNPRFLAVGDAVGRMMLAHVASAEALVAVENLFGSGRPPLNYHAVPSAVFTLPPVASVGQTEVQAKEDHEHVATAKFPFAALGKAVAVDQTDGLVKIIYDEEDGKILGLHILGAEAPELIHEGALAIQHGLSLSQLGHTVHAHPTFSEAIMEAAHMGLGGPIHVMPR